MELVVPRYYVYEDVPLRTDMRGDSSHIAFDYILDADEHPFTATATCPSACATCPWPTPRNTTSCRKRKMAKFHGRKIRQRMDKDTRTLTRHLLCGRGYHCPANHSYRSGRMAHQPKYPFRIKDMESGIGSYKVYIDGKFVLFGLKKAF